jgi:16S rRNA (cytidine1402-2'-O)-methyltransferase
LRDITLRALDVLMAADAIGAEDTRVTRRLLEHYGIHTHPFAVHEHNEARAAERAVALLRAGKSVALVSDAGTPAISDPGARFVRHVRAAGFRIVPIPGPSALTAALSASGLVDDGFLFCGFLPAQAAGRRRQLQRLRAVGHPLVLYEAPHRVRETLADLAEALGGGRRIVIARELTKLFESVHACALSEALAWLDADPHRLKGEFVLVVEGARAPEAEGQQGERVLAVLLRELPLKHAVQLAAEITGAKRNALYARALEMTGG